MRYKQRKRRSDLIMDKNTIKPQINGKIMTDEKSDENLEPIANEDTNEDTNEDSNDTNNDQQNEVEINVKTENNVNNKSKIDKKSKQSSMSSANDLTAKLKENDSYFSSLIDLIPAKIYFEGNDEILESMEQKKKNMFGDDLELSLSKKSKQKRFKLDPNSGQKISEIADNFYNKSNKNSKEKQSMDNKMEELRKKLNERIIKMKSKRGQKSKNLRESKKQRKLENKMRAHKQKGFSKRQIEDTNGANNDNTTKTEPKPKKVKTEDTTDGTDTRKKPKTNANTPKIYNEVGNIVYSKFDLVTPHDTSLHKNKFAKKNKLEKLLAKSKKEEHKMSELEAKNAPKAQEVKEKKLWRKAIDLSEGIKVKDNSRLIKKALMKKRNDKKRSTQKWTERTETLQKSMDAKQQKRQKNIKDRKKDNRDRKLKRMKKSGHIVDTK